MKMVTGRDRKNLNLLLKNNPDIIADIVTAYQAGENVDKTLENWTGHGTSGAAIKEYLETLEANPKPKPRKRSTKTKKDTPPSLEN